MQGSVKLEHNREMMNEFVQPDAAVDCERPVKVIDGYKELPIVAIEVASPPTYKTDFRYLL
ncbi:hypothetical protein [Thermaerobacillus caldiproteolyticus]|uniref:hypothetical protein n=1 Tax=Thermaerobacillus caldiproteolyticus TaxID=247480 RepID=UPI001E5DB374|nr:hypothetical protein [Anoxybacillus caldiproteolyticus]